MIQGLAVYSVDQTWVRTSVFGEGILIKSLVLICLFRK